MANLTGRGCFKPGNQEAKKKKIPDDVKEMIRKATPLAIKFLHDVMVDPKRSWELRVKCAENLADRGLGKPNQPISADIRERLVLIRPANSKDVPGLTD